MKAYDDIKAALVHLADVTTQVHATLQSTVIEAGVRALEATGGGGGSKNPPAEVVRSILGIG